MSDNKAKILKILKARKIVRTQEITKALGISRQKAVKHLNHFVKSGLVQKQGATRSAVYSLATQPGRKPTAKQLLLLKQTLGLREDLVYNEIELRLGLKALPANVQNITFYAFGEMLNNVIDHSGAPQVTITVQLDLNNFTFKIRDKGVGIFSHVRKKFRLHDEFEALEHILKGKQTTFPERHSGQGIFFTSRIADIFTIRSHKIEFNRNNNTNDLSVKNTRFLKGTEVKFQIRRRSRKILKSVFVQFANEDYEFDRTQVTVKLTAERELLARSQAKRILMGLEKFKLIIFDFAKVHEVGQAFIDEVFRVYKARFPNIQITYINANPAVEFMVQRGLKN